MTLGVMSGILMSLYFLCPMSARTGETGLGPYSAALLFALACCFRPFCTRRFSSISRFKASPLQLGAYFKGTKKQHLLGFRGRASCGWPELSPPMQRLTGASSCQLSRF